MLRFLLIAARSMRAFPLDLSRGIVKTVSLYSRYDIRSSSMTMKQCRLVTALV